MLLSLAYYKKSKSYSLIIELATHSPFHFKFILPEKIIQDLDVGKKFAGYPFSGVSVSCPVDLHI